MTRSPPRPASRSERLGLHLASRSATSAAAAAAASGCQPERPARPGGADTANGPTDSDEATWQVGRDSAAGPGLPVAASG
jgi:hypothetical protein